MADQPKIVVDRYKFDFDLGLKILKAKYKDINVFKEKCYISKPLLKRITDEWDGVKNITVNEALGLENIEARRICFRHIGVDNVFKELEPELMDKQVLNKNTKVNDKGDLEAFEDTYELYKVKGDKVLQGVADNFRRGGVDFFILRCKCTSSDREYLIYIQDIWGENGRARAGANVAVGKKPDAIEAVAWTIQVEVEEKDIDYIIRQGDCIIVKTNKENYKKCAQRHISKKEYLEKVKFES